VGEALVQAVFPRGFGRNRIHGAHGSVVTSFVKI